MVASIFVAVASLANDPTRQSVGTGDVQIEADAAVQIVDSGFSTYSGQFGEMVASYGVILRNTNTQVASELDVSVELVESDGGVVASRSHLLYGLAAGEMTGVAGQHASITGEVVGLRVTLTPGPESNHRPDRSKYPNLIAVSDVKIAPRFEGDRTITSFKVTSNSSVSMQRVEAFSIWRDDSGEITGGSSGFVDLPANTTVERQLAITGTPEIESAEVFLNW